MTLIDHAKAWWIEQGNQVPDDPEGLREMYEKWVEYAFADFPEP